RHRRHTDPSPVARRSSTASPTAASSVRNEPPSLSLGSSIRRNQAEPFQHDGRVIVNGEVWVAQPASVVWSVPVALVSGPPGGNRFVPFAFRAGMVRTDVCQPGHTHIDQFDYSDAS